MTVFAMHTFRKDFDVTPALYYGDLRYINLRYVYGDEVENQRLPPAIEGKLTQAANDFDPARDFLLIAGDHSQLLCFTAALARRGVSPFCVLRWDKKAEGYIPIWI